MRDDTATRKQMVKALTKLEHEVMAFRIFCRDRTKLYNAYNLPLTVLVKDLKFLIAQTEEQS